MSYIYWFFDSSLFVILFIYTRGYTRINMNARSQNVPSKQIFYLFFIDRNLDFYFLIFLCMCAHYFEYKINSLSYFTISIETWWSLHGILSLSLKNQTPTCTDWWISIAFVNEKAWYLIDKIICIYLWTIFSLTVTILNAGEESRDITETFVLITLLKGPV